MTDELNVLEPTEDGEDAPPPAEDEPSEETPEGEPSDPDA